MSSGKKRMFLSQIINFKNSTMLNLNKNIFILISLLFFYPLLQSSEGLNNDLYQNVLSEVEEILEENHFKKNVNIKVKSIQEKYINSIDSQKMIFLKSDFSVSSITEEINTNSTYVSFIFNKNNCI